MDKNAAVDAFSALGQDMRLAVFRLVVQREPEGMHAGDISAALGVPPNTLSSNLNRLVAAQLLTREREGRAIRYRLNRRGVREVLSYLLEDCCGGGRAACTPLLDDLLPVVGTETK